MIDTLQELMATLRRSKLRTTLTGISVSTGMFLLILLLGAGNGIIHAFENVSGSLSLDVMEIYGGTTSMPYHGLKEGRQISLDKRDLNIAGHNFKNNVRIATGQMSQGNVTIRYGKQSVSRDITGVSPQYREMNSQAENVAEGRFINEIDIRERRKVIVISQKDANELFGSWRNAVGKLVDAQNVAYRVVGVYPDKGMSRNQDVFMPLNTLQAVYGKADKYNVLSLKTKGIRKDADVEDFAAQYRRFAGPVHQYSPDDKNAVWMWNTTTGAEEKADAMNILHIALWVIGLLTLISGVVGISNIMLITVKERTHEFGIRKALGARPVSILKGVIIESVVVTTVFGYIGMVLGVIATEYMSIIGGDSKISLEGMTLTVFSNPTVDFSICIKALLVMVAAGVIAGLIPARKAVKVKPIEALRAE